MVKKIHLVPGKLRTPEMGNKTIVKVPKKDKITPRDRRIRSITVRPPLQNRVKDELVGYVKANGVHSHRIEDKFRSGVPDWYIDGGNWIEVKRIFIPATGKGMSLWTTFSVGQRLYLRRQPCWDRCWAGFFFITKNLDFYFMLCAFDAIDRKADGNVDYLWNEKRMKKYAARWDDKEGLREYIGKFFGPE